MKTKKNKEELNLNEDFSSKIKRIFIELHDYSFYHGSSPIGQKDKRFVGRERLLESFKSVLTNTSKKSGIYLVTGYRGTGKTSFVNKALTDVYAASRFIKSLMRWGALLLAAYLTMIVIFYANTTNDEVSKSIIIWVFSGFLVTAVLLWILYNLSNTINSNFLKRIKEEYQEKAKWMHIKYLEEMTIILFSSVLVLVLFVCWPTSKIKYENVALYCFWAFLGIFIFIYVYKHFSKINDNISGQKNSRNISKKYTFLSIYLTSFINRIKRIINFSSTIQINLNLGYSNLKEINILKLIARSIKTDFRNHRKRFTLSKCFQLLIIILIVFVCSKLYHNDSAKKFNIFLKNATGLTLLFPSQHEVFVNNDKALLIQTTDSLQKSNRLDAMHYYLYVQSLEQDREFYKDLFVAADVFSYLSLFDKSLLEFLNIDKMLKHSDRSFEIKINQKVKQSFEDEFNWKVEAFESFLAKNAPELKDKLGVLKYLRNNDFKPLKSDEFVPLVKYLIKSKSFTWDNYKEKYFKFLFLYRLYNLNDLYSNYNNYNSFQKKAIAAFNYADYFVYLSYYHIKKMMPFGSTNLLPKQIDYLFIFYIIVIYLLFSLLNRLFNFNRPTLRSINKKIDFINDLIDSALTVEKNADLRASAFSFSGKKSQHFAKADEREIEKFIIEIINDIGKLPINRYRAEFIFIFDELDKIEPVIEKDYGDNSKTSFYSPEGIRHRQQAIMSLLSNLKFFLSTAQAKFIFIAGREMFDAALADVSDRNFRIGSIFHDVFYLNSFYSDLNPYDIEEITSRTEQYVCQFLMPLSSSRKLTTLKDYNLYLKKYYPEFNEDLKTKNYEKIIARQKREKVIYVLQQFIVFLNHQSAGAPSKITSYFENFVVSREMFQENWNRYCIVAGKKDDYSENLFLFFDYYDQYELGFLNYLITPFNYSINKSIRNYGDKLIVSASFLHNHIFKFHRNAFSWRDLEAAPEMVDINKNPELRDFLGRLIEFMLRTHIQEVINGMYDFKFPKKISQEMLYLSHVSEGASASYNFTLDESLNIKHHYLSQLQKLKDSKEITEKDEKKFRYHYSVSSVFLTLGDICFYDGDFGEAINYYLEAIQELRTTNVNDLTITQLALLTRDMLKLGHALEKRKTYDSAHLTYCEITDKILEKIQSVEKSTQHSDFLKSVLNNINYLYQPLLAKLHLIEKTSGDGVKSSDLQNITEEFKLLTEPLKDQKDKYLIKSEFLNKIGNLLYYKNSVLEHKTECRAGYNPDELFNACSACKKYQQSLEHILLKNEVKIDVKDDFFKPIYKYIFNSKNTIRNDEVKIFAIILSNYSNAILSCNSKGVNVPSVKFLSDLSEKTLRELEIPKGDEYNRLDKVIYLYLCSAYLFRYANDHTRAAFQYTCILNLLNTVVVFNKDFGRQNSDIVKKISENIASNGIKANYCSYDHIHNYEINRFKKIFNPENNVVYKNISLKRNSINTDLDEINILVEEIKLNLKEKIEMNTNSFFQIYNIVSPYSLNTNMYNRILKLQLRSKINKSILIQLGIPDISITDENPKINYNNLFCSFVKVIDNEVEFCEPENKIQTIELLKFLISDTVFCCHEITKICNIFDKSFSINYSMMAENHSRLWEWTIYLDTYLILQSAMIKLTENSNVNSFQSINNCAAYIQNTYKKLSASETELRNEIDKINDSNYIKQFVNSNRNKRSQTLIENIENLIEPDNFQFISSLYQCEKAINSYFAMQFTHKQGQAYKNLLENMHYLNDDFNDELYHFSVALERYKLNTGKIDKKIEFLKKQIKDSLIYQHESYVNELV